MYSPRPSITLSQRLRLPFAAPLILLLLAATLAGCGVPVPVGAPVGAMAPVSIYEGEEAKSLEEAQDRVSFQIAVPGVAPGDYNLTWIGTSPADFKDEAEGQFVRLVYSDGRHHILVGQGPRQPPGADAVSDDTLARLHSQRIIVRGQVGRGHGAITVDVPVAVVDEKTITMTIQVPANMEWWPSGLLRAIWTPDDLSITLEDLIAMAESMEPAQ